MKTLFTSRTPFEKCYLITDVRQLSFVPGNRSLRMSHVKKIFKAFLDGVWMPPIYILSNGEVLDGQNRLAAFRMLKEKYPDSDAHIRVMVVDSDKNPLQLAIEFNAKHLNWSTKDYMEAYLENKVPGYIQLQDFMKAYPEFELKAAIQLIKGSYSSTVFKEGRLEISNEEYLEAAKKAGALYLIAEKLNNQIVFRRDIVLAFHHVWNKIPNIQTYVKKLKNFNTPLTETRKEWERAYEDLLR